jgi:hypothetical protein
MVSNAHAHVVCLVETKLHYVNQWLIASMLGMNYNDFAYVPAANTRGGIIVAAHSPEVALQDPHIDCYLATVKVVSMSNEPWWLSVVYGGHSMRRPKPCFWRSWRPSETSARGLGPSSGTST